MVKRILYSTLCKLRSQAFWGNELIRQGEIRKAYNFLKQIEQLNSNSEQLIDYHNEALSRLINHAKETTIFYKDMKSASRELSSFPVVNKSIIRERQDDFISNQYNKSSLITMSTSGSTGTPFLSYQNLGKKKRVHAEVIYFSGKAGYKVGNNLIFLRALTNKSRKSKLSQFLQNETLIDINRLDKESIHSLLADIEKVSSLRGSVILAYASTYDALKDYIQKNNVSTLIKSNVRGIISSSELLHDDTRLTISKAFNCSCYSRYANQENGVLGQDTPDKPNTFILNEAHYYFEVLRFDSNKPVKDGEVGRIVVTDLYNYAMPMIRYDTGDIGAITFVNVNGVKKRAITNFGGRKLDMVFDINGNRLSPNKISTMFWAFNEVTQFQFIQKSKKEYEVKLNVDGKFERELELKRLLQEMLGANAVINIKTVKEIPVLASGKRKYVINEMEEKN